MHQDKFYLYYKQYYLNDLGLSDWHERIESRRNEVVNLGEPLIQFCRDSIGYDFCNKRCLVVGSGTGAEAIALSKVCVEVYAIEPSAMGVEITKEQAVKYNVSNLICIQSTAEEFQISDIQFDFILCYTVLEHVQDVRISLANMLDHLGEQGLLFLEFPNYNYPLEQHYKLPILPILPKRIALFVLKILGRSPAFYNTLNFLTEKKVLNLLEDLNARVLKLILPPNQYKAADIGWKTWLIFYLPQILFNQRKDIYFIVSKKKGTAKL